MADRCASANKDGSPCSAKPLPERDWCHWHDPDREEIRRESRRRGGFNSSAEARARKALRQLPALGNVNDLLKIALMDVYAGTIDPKVANAMGNLAARIESLSITTEYGEEIATERDELARLRQAKQA